MTTTTLTDPRPTRPAAHDSSPASTCNATRSSNYADALVAATVMHAPNCKTGSTRT